MWYTDLQSADEGLRRSQKGAQLNSRGITRERQAQDLLEQKGWVVTRCAGSKGAYDLHASKSDCETRLIEVKSTSRGPYHGFGPRDRAELVAAAERAGAIAILCWWPPRKQPEWICSSEWPT